MKPRTVLAGASVALLAAGSLAPAQAAPKKKPITGSFTFTDNTVDPTYDIQADKSTHCEGKLPKEAAHELKIPAAGKLKVSLSEFTGDWALQIHDSAGKLIGGDDANPPDAFESASVKIKKAGVYKILPCNIGGTTTAKVKYTITF